MKVAAFFMFWFWVTLILELCGSCSAAANSFISWRDMSVDENPIQRNLVIKTNGNGVNVNANANANANGDASSRVIVVDPNGGGDSVTVQGAVKMVPDNNSQRVKILIRPGIYREKVHVPITKPYVSFIGNGSNETVITWSDKASDIDSNGYVVGTYNSASVTIESDYFCATGITFENTVVAEPGDVGMQAVALRIAGDKAMFYKVSILGSQDTLLDDIGTHYFYQSHIQGSIDFIFGQATSLYQNCTIRSTAKRYGAIAAHHRESEEEQTGFSFVNCVIDGTGQIFLGRAWGSYSRAVYSNCLINDVIDPTGWSDWESPERQKTAVFGEYNCRGRGAQRGRRVPWSKSLSEDEVRPFLSTDFIYGNQWLRL